MFVYDPEVPVLAPGGRTSAERPLRSGALELGNNLLVYTSTRLVRETEIFGQPRIRLYAATSAPHADFTAKLVRVSQRARGVSVHRHCAQFVAVSAMRLRGGRSSSWEFTLEPIAFVLAPGERLRLEIASSAFPLYDRNPSTGTFRRNWRTTGTGRVRRSRCCTRRASFCACICR